MEIHLLSFWLPSATRWPSPESGGRKADKRPAALIPRRLGEMLTAESGQSLTHSHTSFVELCFYDAPEKCRPDKRSVSTALPRTELDFGDFVCRWQGGK